MPTILAELQPYDPGSGSAVTLRLTDTNTSGATTTDGLSWLPLITRAPRRSIDLFDGDFSGQLRAGVGDMEIAFGMFPQWARYAWGERPVKLWRGEAGQPLSSYTLIFQGLTRQARAGGGRMQIGLRVDDRWLDRPLLATYGGTGAVEGPAELRGTPKPLAIGAPQFTGPVLINRTLNIYQVHGYGSIRAVPTVLDRLSRFSGGAFLGNDANYAALAAATIPAGSWRSCLAEGLIRFGAPPLVPSAMLEGDNGSALGWVRTPGQVIRRLALIAGASAGQIDATSLAALDTACPYNISLYLTEQTTARQIIQAIAASCNAAAGVGFDGRLFVARAVIGTPGTTLSAPGVALPPVQGVAMLEASAPFWRTAIEAERSWRVHGEGDFGLLAAGDVSYADGSPVESLQPAVAGATRNIVTYSATAPASPADGDLWVDISGSYAVFNLRTGGAWQTGANALTAYNALSGRPIALADINTTESSKLAGIEAGADVTATSVPRLLLPAVPVIKADYNGTVLSGQLPRDLQASRFRGTTDVTSTTTWSITATGCTATISSAGLISITAVATTGKILVTSVRDGVTLTDEFAVVKEIAAPPVTGGGGGGGSSSASTSTIGSVGSSSYSGVQAGPLTVRAGSAGTVNLSAPLDVTVASGSAIGTRGKWQWRIVGGSFADVATEIASTLAASVGEPGYIEVTQSKSGLTPGSDYEFQLLLRRVSGTGTVNFAGTAAAVAA